VAPTAPPASRDALTDSAAIDLRMGPPWGVGRRHVRRAG
jgi:hypothetical protein